MVSEYQKLDMGFVLQAINHPNYLEDITGLTELMRTASAFELNWDDETEVDGDDFLEIWSNLFNKFLDYTEFQHSQGMSKALHDMLL